MGSALSRETAPSPEDKCPSPSDKLTVQGKVQNVDGTAVTGAGVLVVDVDLRDQQELGRTVTSETGEYKVFYTKRQFSRPEKGSADLKVRAYNHSDCSTTPDATSSIIFNAPDVAIVDLVIGGDAVIGPSEFDVLYAAIKPVLGKLKPSDLVEDDEHQDISFLAGETGQEASKIQIFAISHRYRLVTKVPADVFYGLLRQNLPTDLDELLVETEEALAKALHTSVSNNIIKKLSTEQINSYVSALHRVGVQTSVTSVGGGSTANGQVLSAATDKPELFMAEFAKHDGPIEAFWDNLETKPEFKGQVPNLQFSVQLGAAALSHAPLVKELLSQKANGRISVLSDLSALSFKDWMSIIEKPGVGAPDIIPGDNATEKAHNYAQGITRLLEDTFPTKFVASRLLDRDDDDVYGDLVGKQDVNTFLAKNSDFSFTGERTASFVIAKPESLDGIEDTELLKGNISAMQRLYRIGGQYSGMRALLAGGITSAREIAAMGPTTFSAKFGEKLGGIGQAAATYDRALQTHAVATHFLASFGNIGSVIENSRWIDWGAIIAGLSSRETGIPDWSTLFNTLDLCSCSECRSTEGPAAYYVDILHFLKGRLLVRSVRRDAKGVIVDIKFKQRRDAVTRKLRDENAKDILFDRRSDLGDIELSCGNTNIALPYIDLTNEILENAVSPLPKFNKISLPSSAVAQLNSKNLDQLRNSFTPPLSVLAEVTVVRRSQNWLIDETAYTYTLRRTTAGVDVVARSLQTKGTSRDRIATPQYVNWEAYRILSKQVYPLTLPFDLSITTARTYLAHVGVGRYEFMEIFLSATRGAALEEPTIVHEFLGITPFEAKLITGTVTEQEGAPSPGPWNLWGIAAQNLSSATPIPDPAKRTENITTGAWNAVLVGRVDVFLRQSGIRYQELLNIAQVGLAFGGETTISIAPQQGVSQDTCDPSKLRITGLGQDGLVSVIRFIRLARKLEGWRMFDLARVVDAFGQFPTDPAEMEAFIVRTSHIRRLMQLLGLPLEIVLAFWTPLSGKVYRDYENSDEDQNPQSLYAEFFRNLTVSGKPEEQFPDDPGKLSGKLSESTLPIAAALGISPIDYNFLLANDKVVTGGEISVDNLSRLFRHTSLAAALPIDIQDYLPLLNLVSSDPFRSTTDTVLFVERVRNVQESGFSWLELNYLLRHDFTVDSGIGPSDESLSQTLEDIRSGLRDIAKDNTFDTETVDENGDLTKKKLALLSWDSAVVAQVVGSLDQTATFAVPLSTPPDIIFPPSLREKINYDSSKDLLIYSRVMTVEERDALKAISGASPEFTTAVDSLFQMPRTFFTRNARTFSIITFSADLASFPSGVKIPGSLRKKVYFDRGASKLNSIGALTDAERQFLFDLTSDTAFTKAVKDLYEAANHVTPGPGDKFITTADISAWFDSAIDASGNIIVPATRFRAVLAKLIPYVREKLSNQLIRQKISQSVNSDSEIVENLLLRWLQFESNPINDVFRTSTFSESSERSSLTRDAFPNQFAAVTLLIKVGMIISKLKLTSKQLGWIFLYRKIAGDPTVGWLDLNALPLTQVELGVANFVAWERLFSLTRLRDACRGGEKLLDKIFTMARSDAARTSPAETKKAIIDLLVADLKTQAEDLDFLVGPQGFNLAFPVAFQDEVALTRLIRADRLFRKAGCTSAKARAIASPELSEEDARAVKQAIKSKYDQAAWSTVVPALNNILRDAQRAALVAYLLAHPRAMANPSWRTPNDLYAYFLIDVEMGPCQKTSRIKQAICSVQLFVQRCLLNLEPDVTADEETDGHWKQWFWMKSFRLAGANKQVFEMPENFLEPSVRDDKTEFFKEFETELQQGDLGQEMAETAVLNYLEKLDNVSRIEVVSYYHQEEQDGSGNKVIDILHIFARAKAKPSKYYYCKRIDSSYWTGWEKMDVDIQGDHLIPIIWNRRLYLFWAVFGERQEKKAIKMPGPNQFLNDGKTFWQIKLAWTEKKQGKWVPKTISDEYITLSKSGAVYDERDGENLPGRTLITFRAAPNPDTGELWIRCCIPRPVAYFYFNGMRGQPQVQLARRYLRPDNTFIFPDDALYTVHPTAECTLRNMGFTEKESSDGQVWVRTETVEKLALLKKTPGYRFNLAVPHQDIYFISQRPFWFQHDQQSYFVEKKLTEFTIPGNIFANPRLMSPRFLDGSISKPYFETAVPKVLPDHVPRPDVSGAFQFAPTFEYVSDLNATLKKEPPISNLVASGSLPDEATAPAFVPRLKFGDLDLSKVSAVRNVDTSGLRIVPSISNFTISFLQFKFSSFYHPYVSEFIKTLNRDGLDGLYQRPLQQFKSDTFVKEYDPTGWVNISERPMEMVDFDDNIFSVYNWELFYHVPVTIAERLSKNQKFQEAQKWYHYVFDPTDTSSLSVPQRYWKTKKLFEISDEQYTKETIKNILNFLAKGGDTVARSKLSPTDKKYLELLESNVARWRDEPFSPFVVARGRITAFQKSVVMKYLDNLIAWGDYLFRGDTIELINEATQLYILAAEILGPRPVEMAPRASAQVQTYSSLEPRIDAYGNALAAIENLVTPIIKRPIIKFRPRPQSTPASMTYFCVPKNAKLLSYWDTVSDRLFKIRHCMNLMGIVRELPLFEPPIDPALLIRAKASGADISSAVADINAPLPRHRYIYLSNKATEMCQELKVLGNAIVAALEKKDSGELALLNSTQGMKMLDLAKEIKRQQVVDSLWAVDILNKSKDVVTERQNFYNDTSLMNFFEITHMSMEGASMVLALLDGGAQTVSGTLTLIPDAKIGAPTSMGFTLGGMNMGKSASKFGKFLEKSAIVIARGSGMVATMANHVRRKDQDDLQFRLASNELKQIASQIESANVRNAIAQKDFDNHEVQIGHAKETDEFLRSKYTNVELYDWMLSQLTTVYFQTYKLVFDAAKRAERAFANELAVDRPDFITVDYWNGMKKGLMAGERLFCDIKRMDMAYMDQDVREYEITRNVSLAQLDPVALIQLRTTGACFFTVPEEIFDLDFPGHYMRRIKAVTVTICCIAGPHASVSSTLSLLQSSVRKSNTLTAGKYARQDNDVRFSDVYGQFQSIVTSTGTNDSGMFEASMRDERYLPFERAGAISSWKMEMPMAFKQYDYDSISDVVLHMRYTARQGGAVLGEQASKELKDKALDAIAIAEGNNGLSRLFDLGREFPDLWYKFLTGTAVQRSGEEGDEVVTGQFATLPFTNNRFPYLFSGASSISITAADVFVRVKPDFLSSHSADSLTITLSDSSTVPGDALSFSEWRASETDASKGKVFRATKTWKAGKPLGNYYLSGSLNEGAEKIDVDAISHFLIVVHYKVKWA